MHTMHIIQARKKDGGVQTLRQGGQRVSKCAFEEFPDTSNVSYFI